LLKRHLPLDANGLRLAHNVLACPAADQLVAAEKPFPVERERQANAEKQKGEHDCALDSSRVGFRQAPFENGTSTCCRAWRVNPEKACWRAPSLRCLVDVRYCAKRRAAEALRRSANPERASRVLCYRRAEFGDVKRFTFEYRGLSYQVQTRLMTSIALSQSGNMIPSER
jgi:hypothetical protein